MGYRQVLAWLVITAFVLTGLPQAFAASFLSADSRITESGAGDIHAETVPIILESAQQNDFSAAKRRTKARTSSLATEPPDPIELPTLSASDRIILGPATIPAYRSLATLPCTPPYEALAPPTA